MRHKRRTFNYTSFYRSKIDLGQDQNNLGLVQIILDYTKKTLYHHHLSQKKKFSLFTHSGVKFIWKLPSIFESPLFLSFFYEHMSDVVNDITPKIWKGCSIFDDPFESQGKLIQKIILRIDFWEKSTPSWPLSSKLHHQGHGTKQINAKKTYSPTYLPWNEDMTRR